MCAAREQAGQSHSRRELHALLLRVEEAHRADILTYCSGHLNPDRLSQKASNGTAKEPKWMGSFAPEKNRARMLPEVERMRNGSADVTGVVSATLVTTDSPRPEKGRKHPCHLPDATQILKPSRSVETGPATGVPEDRYCLTESLIASVTRKDQLRTRLRESKGLGRSKAVEQQERRLEQVLKKLGAEPHLSRERLQILSKIFGDVCNGSQGFGQILREIKTEYDLYLNLVLSSHPSPQNMAHKPGAPATGDLEEARDEVLRLESDARKALLDNDQARMELKRERGQVQQINGERKEVEQQDSKQGVVLVSPSDQVLQKRRQVWTALDEIRLLENVIREQMAPKDTIRATERYIRDLEAEIAALTTSNKHFCEANEDLQRNVSSLMGKVKVTADIQEEFWRRFGTP